MVRKRKHGKYQRLSLSAGANGPAAAAEFDGPALGFAMDECVQKRLESLRQRLPKDAKLTLTVHREARFGYLLSMRAAIGDEIYLTEVKDQDVERALASAERSLEDRVSRSPPAPGSALGVGRFWSLFSVAG
jgi:hypothetical protein